MRAKVLEAYGELKTIQKRQLAMQELPVAQLTSLMANVNRDAKSTPKPFAIQDFAIFWEPPASDQLSPNAAMVALSLRREQLMPSVLGGVWPQVLAAAKEATAMLDVWALISD